MKKQNKDNENGWRSRFLDLFKFSYLMPIREVLPLSASTLLTLSVLIITIIIGFCFSGRSEKHELFLLNIISTLIGVLGALSIFCIGLDINKKRKDETKNKRLKQLYECYKQELNENITIAGDLISTKKLSPYKFSTLIRDNTWGTDHIENLDLLKILRFFYVEVDRIIQLICKINFYEQGKSLNMDAYSKEFQTDINTAANRIRIHGTDCLNKINNLLNES